MKNKIKESDICISFLCLKRPVTHISDIVHKKQQKNFVIDAVLLLFYCIAVGKISIFKTV